MKSIRKLSLLLLSGNAITLLLEALPFGAVLVFANYDGGSLIENYSYFDIIPYGYANAGPFITAILTCVLFILSAVCLVSGKKAFLKGINTIALIAFAASVAPLFFGIRYFTLTALAISLLLFAQFVISALQLKK